MKWWIKNETIRRLENSRPQKTARTIPESTPRNKNSTRTFGGTKKMTETCENCGHDKKSHKIKWKDGECIECSCKKFKPAPTPFTDLLEEAERIAKPKPHSPRLGKPSRSREPPEDKPSASNANATEGNFNLSKKGQKLIKKMERQRKVNQKNQQEAEVRKFNEYLKSGRRTY